MKTVLSFFKSIGTLFKKDLRLYGARIVSLLLLLCLLMVGCAVALEAVLVSAKSEEDAEKPLRMALYDKEPSSMARGAMDAIANTETVQSMFDIDICDSEQEVREGMKNGTYDAGIVFEESYLSKILNGDDAGVCILMSDKLTPMNQLIEHFAISGEELIKIAESGVEATYDYISEEYPDIKASDITNPMQINYALEIFAMPNRTFSIEILPYSSSGVELICYYLLCFTVFLMVLCEVVFFPYMAEDCSRAMLCRIKSYKISNTAIIIEKSILPFFIRVALLSAIVYFASSMVKINLSLESVLQALAFLFLISLFLSALSALLSQTPLGISIIFAISAASLVMGGGLIPAAMLPYEMIAAGGYTPSGLGIKMLAPLFGGVSSAMSAVILTAATLLLMLLACLYMTRICKRGGDER